MRGMSLRCKINLAIFLAFVASAVAFGSILHLYVANRQASAQNRSRVLLAILAAHRLEALRPLLHDGNDMAPAQDILDRMLRVEGVIGADLFDAKGDLMAHAGTGHDSPLASGDSPAPLPTSRMFTVAATAETLTATLVEPIRDDSAIIGYLRLRYSLQEIQRLNQHLWLVGSLAVLGAYLFLAAILNLLLHHFVLRPVNALRQGLEAVQAGRMGHTVPVFSPDALGRVAMAFNSMSAQLRTTCDSLGESRAEIEEHRRLLAKRVEERTAELAEANQRLTEEIQARTLAEANQAKSLALYKAILESTAEAVVCVGMMDNPVILAHNRRFIEMWNLPEDWASIEPPENRLSLIMDKTTDPGTILSGVRSLLTDTQSMAVDSVSLRDGRVFERRSGPINQGSTCIGRVFSYIDATEERQRRQLLEQAKAAAEETSRAKGAFLAVMSHEIRTPLNAISGLAEELLADTPNAVQRGHLRTIQEATAHLLGIISDVLDISKIEAGKLVLERTDFLVRDLIEATAQVLSHEARHKKLRFDVNVHPDVPPVLRGDPGRLRQVLLNLLGNAVKFTEHGGVSLDVSLAPRTIHDDGHVGLVVRISDTGIGMAPENLVGIFQSFHQGPHDIARRYGGTGLGLSISKEIVERMGGRIEAISRQGEGSTFVFTVKLLPGSRPAHDVAAEAPGPAAQSLHILLVEDNPLNASVTRLHMERMGHRMREAASAKEAYELLARDPFDVVLMDIEMPEIDGITAARTIRGGGPADRPVLNPGVPIIAVTAHAIDDVRQQCLAAGMDGFITKPVNYQLLRQALAHRDHNSLLSPESAIPTIPREIPAPAHQPPADDHCPAGAALFDPEAARGSMSITWEQFTALLPVSHAEADRRLGEAVTAMEAGDFKAAKIAAHTFKSAAATIGAFSSRDLAVSLEKALHNQDLNASRQLAGELEALWGQVGTALSDWHPPLPDPA